MSKPYVHKNRIIKYLEKLRHELRVAYEEHHVEYPKKSFDEVDLDINDTLNEIERVNFTHKEKK